MDFSTASYYSLPMPGYRPPTQEWSRQAHVARVKAALLRAAQDTLDAEGYTQVVAPLLTSMSGACGDPGTLISVDVRGRQAYLRQTSQLYLEPWMRQLGKVYSISRSFRSIFPASPCRASTAPHTSAVSRPLKRWMRSTSASSSRR